MYNKGIEAQNVQRSFSEAGSMIFMQHLVILKKSRITIPKVHHFNRIQWKNAFRCKTHWKLDLDPNVRMKDLLKLIKY